ncbi:phosphoribosylformylglycinamidine synthase [Mollicutes bacterium LVI A0039]|nr:phosphoribosylformylglycinamidine synthase [Mollicutes bacterium LVI A0039]
MNKRIFVEKKAAFATEAESLKKSINYDLGIDVNLRYFKVYDIFDTTEEEVNFLVSDVIATSNKDIVSFEFDLNANYISSQLLPGTYDNRAAACIDCLQIKFASQARVYTGEVYLLEDDQHLEVLAGYLINPIEKQKFNIEVLAENNNYLLTEDYTHSGFIGFSETELLAHISEHDLSLNINDLKWIQEYFRDTEKRDPTHLELGMLETYWSDHCRHSTFETILDVEQIADDNVREVYEDYLAVRDLIGRTKPVTLMDVASLFGRYVTTEGIVTDIEVSDEINACSVYVDVDVDGKFEKWLMMFKNETHNHPTEIEPFGGAATCIGGAIRDPLSGRSYVYQAMRISGSSNPLEPVTNTLPGKLPQSKISKVSAKGNSSYGNQIGLTTSYVREIFDPGYMAKHMELGAVVGATPASHVRREAPAVGDQIILVGGRTGKDGIGGASGSSKEHTADTLASKMAEVQKGNPVEERKLQRLFAKYEVARLIKKSNDFGAGGVSVAIGEIADSIEINLNAIPLKYQGLSSFEIALSESQERMAVVVAPEDVAEFTKQAAKENLEATVVAHVTDSGRLEMKYNESTIVSLSREFLDTNGAPAYQSVVIESKPVPNRKFANDLLESFASLNGASQAGLNQMFDSTIGSATVFAPFGGKYQKSPSDVSAIKFPVKTQTNTASVLAYGYNPKISSENQYLGAMYANVEAISKLIAAGTNLEDIKFTYQEYFERLKDDKQKWGKPLASLLGAFKVQRALGLPSIGGKDSMSGTFKDIDVPPTLVAFAINTIDARMAISNELKSTDSKLFITNVKRLDNGEFDFASLKAEYETLHELVQYGKVLSMKAVGAFGVAHSLAEMGFGNLIGSTVVTEFDPMLENYGQIIIESTEDLPFTKLGETNSSQVLTINAQAYALTKLLAVSEEVFSNLYPQTASTQGNDIETLNFETANQFKYPQSSSEVKVVIPVFPGTNCERDMARAFASEGATVTEIVINNLSSEQLTQSIEQFAVEISKADIVAFSGGFSLGDEPDGSGKFIANIIKAPQVKAAIETHLQSKKLIIGICNGFQGLIESGLLPFNQIGTLNEDSPILFRNDLNEHVSNIVDVKIVSNNSPWLASHVVGSQYKLPISHGEGKFVCDRQTLDTLIANGQIFSQYVSPEGQAVMDPQFNPNGSTYAIEGIVSSCGLILGKMGHNERYTENTLINTVGNYDTMLFKNAVDYIRGK